MHASMIRQLSALCALVVILAVSAESDTLSTPGGWVNPVPWLPGWPEGTKLPSNLFSGYVNITNPNANISPKQQMLMHYFLFESEGNPATDPVIVWWNGGPGASSAWGLFVENGPLLLNEESRMGSVYAQTGIPQLIENPYRWTKFATIVAFCNPPPIGFSYCTPPGPTGNGTACGTWNDTRVGVTDAEGVRVVLEEHFPHLTGPVHFMGESYAGVYIGETLRWMVENPSLYAKPVLQRLAGVALGDACLGSDVLCGGATGPYSTLLFFYGHGQVSTEIWNHLNSICTYEELHSRTQSPQCTDAISAYYDVIGGFYAYNLYDQCENDAFQSSQRGRVAARQLRRSAHQPELENLRRKSSAHKLLGEVLSTVHSNENGDQQGAPASFTGNITIPKENGYWCPGQVFFDYFDRQDVRLAAGVPVDSAFFNADDGEGMNYVYNCKTVMPTLLQLMQNTTGVVGHSVRVWAYDGDGDPSINIFSSQQAWWNFTAGYRLAKSAEWRPWTITTSSNIVGGYVTQWLNGTLSYVSVRGAGHMIPEYKPAAAMILARTFVSPSGDLPRYNSN